MPLPEPDGVHVRPYEPADAAATLETFTLAITRTALARYTAEQVQAWIGTPPSLGAWDEARRAVRTFVAELDGRVAGFSDVDDRGYVDRLFVHPAAARRGVAGALLDRVLAEARRAGLATLTTHASLVAEPVFARHGFEVVARETVHRGDVSLDRCEMRRVLHSATRLTH
ncbi:GNAT family N-acetyltransferase [Aeromicrobium sp. IC_218]|uniref:GNAT family N-acetyltransferase n=1 Tax=Aeromicrobium sp. IC_218 TaxID=2545468 RepID=UPI0013F478AD|nr:GNAT family N-acetyltransferase [Aeromicrobium sp. IC_218]